jgi:hypothetical protein
MSLSSASCARLPSRAGPYAATQISVLVPLPGTWADKVPDRYGDSPESIADSDR